MNKKSFQIGAIKAIKGIAMPVHIGLQVTTNLATVVGNMACNKVANIEGWCVERIDGTPKEETVGLRYEYTQNKMMQAGIKAQQYADKFNKFNEKVDGIMVDAIDKIKHTIVPPPEDAHQDTLEFQLAEARSKRDKLIEKNNVNPTKENSRLINQLNQRIGEIKKAIKLPTMSPDQAFGETQMA